MAAPQRWPAFSLSLILHVGTIGLLTWIDIAFQPPPSPQYRILPLPEHRPDESKIIWYNFRKAVPEVIPDHSFGPTKLPTEYATVNRPWSV